MGHFINAHQQGSTTHKISIEKSLSIRVNLIKVQNQIKFYIRCNKPQDILIPDHVGDRNSAPFPKWIFAYTSFDSGGQLYC